ncbi:hypothetical protein SBA2_40056 [Acidobacteriia bacterium SbA2]|nr:hypothetical protein SBA2_40056 [Acidobacteriia bacterium SbA2]
MADALDGVALAVVEGEEFESVAQALAVADNGADLDGIGREGQRNFESDDLAGFETAGEGGTDAVLTHFGGTSPAGAEFSSLKHLDLQADIDDEAGKAAGEGNFAGRCVGRYTRAATGVGGTGGSGLSFLVFAHTNLLIQINSQIGRAFIHRLFIRVVHCANCRAAGSRARAAVCRRV